ELTRPHGKHPAHRRGRTPLGRGGTAGVDGDALVGDLQREGTRELYHRALARGVRRAICKAD
ncbi:MAG: hypothetical protein V1244_01805, partial [Nitrospinaceae bacterium]|nr:hypothetical protein [Nitrospinaceae bacterium]